MEVTRKNFKETLPLVADSIDKADFLVIDTELTGLLNGRDVSVFDSPEEYYTRLLTGSTEFLLIQYGLCAFYWDEKEKQYMNDSYNFYLFPRGRPERMFLCQSSSLDFLAVQGFDFNKLIKEGISYMTEPTESYLRDNLTERQKLYSNVNSTITIPDENKQQIEDTCNKVRKFLDGASDEMVIDRCNAFIRRLLFQELGTRFKDEAFVETKVLENQSRVLKVSRLTSENDGKSRDMQKKEKEWEELEDAVGFSKVARMISQSEKLVIGHNMLLDLLHTLNHFFQPLPADYATFKEFAHCMFPRLLDTKYMSSLPPFKDKVTSSVLAHLLATLSEPPFSLPEAESIEGRGYRRSDDKQHEAGYDAYVTGLCFLAMHAHLARMRGEPLGRVPTHPAALEPFLNKLFLAKTAHHDSPYMNFAGPDPKPSREHVFHLTFPKEWQRNDINQLFSPFGPITVQFVDDTSALVALSRREQARDVARALASNGRVSLVPYARYKQAGARRSAPGKPQDVSKRARLAGAPSALTPNSPTKLQQANSTSVARSPSRSPQPPQKVGRARSLSASASPPPAVPARKRTSSGVFKVDDAEPPRKRIELVRSNSDSDKKTDTNGRRKAASAESEKEKPTEKGKVKEKNKIVTQKFDIDAKSKCVSAFKESDSWD